MNRSEVLKRIRELSSEDFIEKIAHLELPEKRAQKFYEVINGIINFENIDDRRDIEEFALKNVFLDCHYSEIEKIEHITSNGQLHEFDPAKNGQNIIKHGLSFSEVFSFSENFGMPMILIPPDDADTFVLFSRLFYPFQYELSLPLFEMKDRMYYILSIIEVRGEKRRYISSRFLSSKKRKYAETIKQVLKEVGFPNKPSRDSFIEECVQRLKENLNSPP